MSKIVEKYPILIEMLKNPSKNSRAQIHRRSYDNLMTIIGLATIL